MGIFDLPILDKLQEYAERVNENISTMFQKLVDFLRTIEIAGLNLTFFMVIMLYFLILAIAIYLPLRFYPVILQYKSLIRQFMRRITQ